MEAGALAILSPPQRRRGGSGGDARLFRPWSGEQGRGESDRGGNGPVRRMGQVGRPGCELGRLVQGEGPFLFFFLLSSAFVFSFLFLFCFIQFRAFKYFIKLCLLLHNYLCHFWHCPNIFVSTFENFCCLTYFEFDF